MSEKRRRAELIFEKSVVQDHVLLPRKRLGKIRASNFVAGSHMDSFTAKKSKRIARSVSGSPSRQPTDLLERKKHPPFWQLAPDSLVIERVYNPEDEPLLT
jgi:hypothetical protein